MKRLFGGTNRNPSPASEENKRALAVKDVVRHGERVRESKWHSNMKRKVRSSNVPALPLLLLFFACADGDLRSKSMYVWFVHGCLPFMKWKKDAMLGASA